MFDNGMKATGFGGLTKDSELSYNNNGTAFLKFSLGVSKSRKVGEEYVQDKHYFNCVITGRYGEALQQYLLKGTQVWISGNLNFSSWEKEGQKHNKVEIRVEDLEIIKKAEGSQQNGSQGQQQQNNQYNQGGNNSQNYNSSNNNQNKVGDYRNNNQQSNNQNNSSNNSQRNNDYNPNKDSRHNNNSNNKPNYNNYPSGNQGGNGNFDDDIPF